MNGIQMTDTPTTDAEDTEAFVQEIERSIALWLFEQRKYTLMVDAIMAVGQGEWRKPAEPAAPLAPTPKIIV